MERTMSLIWLVVESLPPSMFNGKRKTRSIIFSGLFLSSRCFQASASCSLDFPLCHIPSPSLNLCSGLEAHLLRLAINKAQFDLPQAPDSFLVVQVLIMGISSVTFLLFIVEKLMSYPAPSPTAIFNIWGLCNSVFMSVWFDFVCVID